MTMAVSALSKPADASVAQGPRAVPAQPIIAVRNLGKTFKSKHGALTVFNGLNFAIERRSFLSVIGPSGCGKSTLLKLISGLETPSGGEIQFNDRTVKGPPKGMIYVFQQYTKSIFPWKTVLQNVSLGLKYRPGVSRDEAESTAREQLRVVGLAPFADYYPYQLSGGMQQRVAIARALARRPEILLMDEPFSALDAMMRVELQDLLLKLWQDYGLTILFVTHDLDEALYVAQRVVMLSGSPGSVAEVVKVPLPYPRNQVETRRDPVYLELRAHLYNLMARQVSAAREAVS